MKKIYQIAGHKLCFTTPLCEAMELLVGFRPFISDAKEEYDFVFEEGNKEDIPTFDKVEYTLEYEDVKGTFGISKQTYLLCLCPTQYQTYLRLLKLRKYGHYLSCARCRHPCLQ